MIRTISNLTNHTTMQTTNVQAPTPAGRTTIFSRTRSLRTTLRLAAVLVLLFAGSVGVKAQNLYVIQNGNYYLPHDASTGAVNTTATNTFSPTTCFWMVSGSNIRPVNKSGEVLGSFYLRARSGNNQFNLNTNTSTTYADWSGGVSDGGKPYYSYNGWNATTYTYYLRLSGTTWQSSTTNSDNGTLYSVSVTNYATGSLTSFSINGNISVVLVCVFKAILR